MIDHGLTSNPWHVNGYNPTKVTPYFKPFFSLVRLGPGVYACLRLGGRNRAADGTIEGSQDREERTDLCLRITC
jgi:hypothetical protein